MLGARLPPLLQGLVLVGTHQPGLHPDHPLDGAVPHPRVDNRATHSKRLA